MSDQIDDDDYEAKAREVIARAQTLGVRVHYPWSVVYGHDPARDVREAVLTLEESGTWRVLKEIDSRTVCQLCGLEGEDLDVVPDVMTELDDPPLFEAPVGYEGETEVVVAFFSGVK